MKKRVLILCDSIGKYLDGMKDTVVQSFSGANLGYIKYVIDKEYIYLHEFDSFSHVILHFGNNDIEKHSIEIILCKFRNLIYSVRNRNRDINILISSILPRPVDFVQLGYKVVQINKALIGPRVRDCSDLDRKHYKSGVYKIYPAGGAVYKAYCDMETNGGGWTVRIFHNNKR
ncbi:unnamed protein product [Mytilus edulis]|uniref:Fibrinogen C-terminal domain-containing protein n=1 Tax=Mytilus edulis TaxID=6550 RepID=A0A8S3U4R5_MYTED|nr:unnamed protein product [Mytilus edulis]